MAYPQIVEWIKNLSATVGSIPILKPGNGAVDISQDSIYIQIDPQDTTLGITNQGLYTNVVNTITDVTPGNYLVTVDALREYLAKNESGTVPNNPPNTDIWITSNQSWSAPFNGFINFILVGGGGKGGTGASSSGSDYAAGGGGAGQIINASTAVTSGTSYPIIIGAAGQSSQAFGFTANPGESAQGSSGGGGTSGGGGAFGIKAGRSIWHGGNNGSANNGNNGGSGGASLAIFRNQQSVSGGSGGVAGAGGRGGGGGGSTGIQNENGILPVASSGASQHQTTGGGGGRGYGAGGGGGGVQGAEGPSTGGNGAPGICIISYYDPNKD